MSLGVASLRLGADVVTFAPNRFKRWRGAEPFTIPYAAITGVSMTEPHGLTPGRLTLRSRRANDTCTVTFRAGQLEDMRRLHAAIWQRARAAREGRDPVD
jgi:hypothetical protein